MAVQRGRSQIRDAKNNEVHDVQNNARQVCERARDGERPVSSERRENKAAGLFQHPVSETSLSY